MATWASIRRATEAAERRQSRDALKRQRELERRHKEQAKLTAAEQARLEVETHDSCLEVLLSVHKEQGEAWDWAAIAASLPPPRPEKTSHHELRARQDMTVLPRHAQDNCEARIEEARIRDEQMFQAAMSAYARESHDWEKLSGLSRRIRSGEASAYADAMNQFSPLTEISHFGSAMEFTVHNPRLIECALTLNSSKVIPTEIKTLSHGGKVSVKIMPLPRFHEIYQDYVCSCMLRVAREVFALLPVETLLLTASTLVFDSATGHTAEKPVLSSAITRQALSRLNFEQLDPSDAVEGFVHRGDFKASRKTGAFVPISPLTPADISGGSVEQMGLGDLLCGTERFRQELSSALAKLGTALTSCTS